MGSGGEGSGLFVELRGAARSVVIPPIRTVAADLAARADFDLDAIDDLRMAVDDLCGMLVRLAAGDAVLWCGFTVGPARIEVAAEVEVPEGGLDRVPTGSFSWRVLECLAEELSVVSVPAQAGRRARVRITVAKHAVRASQP